MYTWLVDHDNAPLCRDPKIAVLGGDPSEWAEDIIEPWRFRIAPREHVFYDLVTPFLQRIGIEEHIAHVILTKKNSDRHSVLVTLDFLQIDGPSVLVRFATALPQECTLADVAIAVPLLDSFMLNEIQWEFPTLQNNNQPFRTRHGMGIHIKILPDGIAQEPQQDVSSLLQITTIDHTLQLEARDLVRAHQILSERPQKGTVTCSLTEEFLAFVQAASTATEGVTAAVDDVPDGLRSQPQWVQDIWEKWVDSFGGVAEDPQRGPRLETWFMNPRRWTRCRTPRIVVLSINFHQWERELLAAWYDRADVALPTNFAVVFPTPDDADRSVQEQIIIEQQPEPFSKSLVMTLYDTAIDFGAPHSVAIVLSDRLDLRGAVTMMEYSEICPPERLQNECSLWLGHIAIRPDQTVNVRTGNAFKLLVKHGIEISISELLSMSDHRLRQELQSAISGSIFRRPNVQGFQADAFSTGNPGSSRDVAPRQQDDYPPDWLNSLQEVFDRQAFVENSDEGAVIYVHVWFVHGVSRTRSDTPAVVRLDRDSAWWRSEIIFPWRDDTERGVATSLHFVDPVPPKEPWQSQVAHILVSQGVSEDQVPVVVSTRSATRDGIRLAHEARIVNKFSSANDLSGYDRSSSSNTHCLVSRGRLNFPSDHTVQIGHGDGIIVQQFVLPEVEGPLGASESAHDTLANDHNASMMEEEVSPIVHASVDESLLGEVDEESLMQGLQSFQNVQPASESETAASSNHQPHACAIDIAAQEVGEQNGFQFNAQAAAFQPGQPLPLWAQVIEDIYHTWDFAAFSWQGEERSAQFMTWFVAPEANRKLCRIGRAAILLADFWNWKERLRQVWINEIDPNVDFEIVFVQPPPAFVDERNVGHIILIQHNAPAWASVLITVFDPYLSSNAPFQLVASVPEHLVLHQLLPPAGYPVEIAHHTICTFRLRNHMFTANEGCRPSDGDSFDIVFQGYGSMPPADRGDEGGAPNFLQLSARVRKASTYEANPDVKDDRRESTGKKVIEIAQHIRDEKKDILGIPFTLDVANKAARAHGMSIVFCVWELNGGNTDILTFPTVSFETTEAILRFKTKFGLFADCSPLFPVNYTRSEWDFRPGDWHVGSFVQPSTCSAVVVCIAYGKQGAHATAKTLPIHCQVNLLRNVLGTKFGSFVRINGSIVQQSATLHHGDVVEFQVAEQVASLPLNRTQKRVQICLDASLQFGSSSFIEEEDAIEVLPLTNVRTSLQAEDAWIFKLIPEGLNLHKMTYEALHQQQDLVSSGTDTLELYVDGATHGDLSAWAVVAVSWSDQGRSFQGCIGGVTELHSGSNRWIGADKHTNIDAEITAMVVATAFAYFGSTERNIVIRPDLALSNKFLKSDSITQQGSVVARVLHVLGQTLPTNVAVSEIRAHCGDPWNELADSVAKWVARSGQSIGSVPWGLLHELASSPSMLKWEWLRSEKEAYSFTMPQRHDDAVWQPEKSLRRVGVHVEPSLNRPDELQIQFKVATYNGLALTDEDQSGPLRGSRSARLDIQFNSHGLALIGIQEARTLQGCKVSENYKIFASGFQQCGKSKHYGCELWVHRKLPLCHLPDGKKVCLNDCKITVRISQARLLIVRIEGPIDFHVVVAHAPCVSPTRPLDLVQEWWTELSDNLTKFDSRSVLMLVDANAPLADRDTKFFLA